MVVGVAHQHDPLAGRVGLPRSRARRMGCTRTPLRLIGVFDGTAQNAGSASRERKSGAGASRRIVSVSPLATTPAMWLAFPAMYARAPTTSARKCAQRAVHPGVQRALDRVLERLRGDRLVGGWREAKAGADLERVGRAVGRAGRQRLGDLGRQLRARGAGLVGVVHELRAGRVEKLADVERERRIHGVRRRSRKPSAASRHRTRHGSVGSTARRRSPTLSRPRS